MSYFTIAERTRCRDNNFTLIRLLAAYAVLFAHSYALATGRSAQDPVTQAIVHWWGQGLGTVAVVIFFIVSGFLVGGSYIHRDNLFAFVEARFLRIFPALAVAVLLCAFVVGAGVTILPLEAYLGHPGTWSFVWHNMTLFDGIHFRLPGVFADNPWPGGVNGSLWTLPIEVYMYCMVLLLGALGILKHRASFNAVAVLLCAGLVAVQQGGLPVEGGMAKYSLLVMAYVAGVFFYVNRAFIPLNMPTLLLVSLFMALLHGSMLWHVAQVFGMAYWVLFLALHPAVRPPEMDRWGDFSYGIYIYAYPVQQLIVKYVTTDPMEVFFYATLVTVPMAILSWNYIEKPSLYWKGKIPIGRRWLDPRVR